MSDFHLIASRLPGAQGAISAAAITATVPDPPRNFLALDNGTILRGTVQGRDKDGLIAVVTDKGIVKIATNANLPAGSGVTLEVRSVGDRLQVVVLAIDQGTAIDQAGGTQGTARSAPAETGQATDATITADRAGRSAGTAAPAPAGQPNVVVAGTRLTAIVIQSVPRDLIQSATATLPAESPTATQGAAPATTARPSGTVDFRSPAPPPVQASLIPSIHDRIATLFADAPSEADHVPEAALADADKAAAKAISAVGGQVGALSLNPEIRQRIIELFVGASADASDVPPPDFVASSSAPARSTVQPQALPEPGASGTQAPALSTGPVPASGAAATQLPQRAPTDTTPIPGAPLPPGSTPPPGTPAPASTSLPSVPPAGVAVTGAPATQTPSAGSPPAGTAPAAAPSTSTPPTNASAVQDVPSPVPSPPTALAGAVPLPETPVPTGQPAQSPPAPATPQAFSQPVAGQQAGNQLPNGAVPATPTPVPPPPPLPSVPGEAPANAAEAGTQPPPQPQLPAAAANTPLPLSGPAAAAPVPGSAAEPQPQQPASNAPGPQPPTADTPQPISPQTGIPASPPPVTTNPISIPSLPDLPGLPAGSLPLPGNGASTPLPAGVNPSPQGGGGIAVPLPPSIAVPSLTAALAAAADSSPANGPSAAQPAPFPATPGLVPQDPTVPTIPISPPVATTPVTLPVAPASGANTATTSDGKTPTAAQQGNVAAGATAAGTWPAINNELDVKTAPIPLTAVVADATKLPLGVAVLTDGEVPAGSITGNGTATPGNVVLPGGATVADARAEYQTLSTLGAPIGAGETGAAELPAGLLPTGTELRLRVLNIQQPGMAGNPLAAAQAAAASAGAKATIIGQILGHTPAGHPVIHSAVGDLVLQQQASLPVGASITLAVEAVEMANASALGMPVTPQMTALNLAQGWPTLLDLLFTLQHGPGGSAQAGGDNDPAGIAHLAQPGSKLAAGLNEAMDAFKSGDFEKLFGPLASALKASGGKQDGVRKLRDEFSQLSMLAQERPQQDWRSFFLPIWDDGRLQQINLFYRRQRRNQAEKESKEDATRFVVEVNFTRLGGCQLDGLIRKKHFDLMVRSHQELPLTVKRDIAGLFAEARELGNYAGDISFQTTARFPVVPLDDVVRDTPSVTA